MKTVMLLVIFFSCFSSLSKAQSLALDSALCNFFFEKNYNYLGLNEKRSDIYNGIRIINLTKRTIKNSYYYKEKIQCMIINSIPLNLNNGEYTDIACTYFVNKSDYVIVKFIFCDYRSNKIGIKQPYSCTFKMMKSNFEVSNFNLTDIDQWDGFPLLK